MPKINAKYIEPTLENVPDPRVVFQHIQLVLGLLLHLCPVLLEGLELVDELVDDLPLPLVGQDELDGRLRAEDVVEEVAVVVVGLEALLDAGAALDAGVDVAVVELAVQDEEEGVVPADVLLHHVRLRPRGRLEELLRQLRVGVLVQVGRLEDAARADVVAQVQQELLHGLRDVRLVHVAAAAARAAVLVLPVAHRVPGRDVVIVVILHGKWLN